MIERDKNWCDIHQTINNQYQDNGRFRQNRLRRLLVSGAGAPVALNEDQGHLM